MKIAMLALALALSGCAGMMAPGNHYGPNFAAPMTALRVRGGACTETSVGWSTGVRTCAQLGSPGTYNDDGKTPVMILKFTSMGFPMADPGNWHLIVNAPDGELLLDQGFERDVPEVGLCQSTGCEKYGIAVAKMPKDWVPGTYKIQLICTFNTQDRADMALTLKAPVAL